MLLGWCLHALIFQDEVRWRHHLRIQVEACTGNGSIYAEQWTRHQLMCMRSRPAPAGMTEPRLVIRDTRAVTHFFHIC